MRSALVVLLAGCSPAVSGAVTFPSCGPTDGPAQTILVVEGGTADCSVAEHGGRAHLAVELWSPDLRESGGALEGSKGSARLCSATGECRALTGASVTLRHEADGTTSGTVTYRDGEQNVSRAFRASHCHIRMMCG